MIFDRFSLKQRLTLGMGVILVPLLLIALSGYLLFQYAVHRMDAGQEDVQNEMMPVAELQRLLLLAQMPANDYLIHGDPREREQFRRLRDALEAGFDLALEAPFEIASKRDLIEQARELWLEGAALSEAILALDRPMGDPAAIARMERMDELLGRASQLLQYVHMLVIADLEQQHGLVHGLHLKLGIMILAVVVLLSLTVLAGVSLIRRWIVAPLEALQAGAERFGGGDLAHRIPCVAQDEIGRVAETLNQMAAALARDREVLQDLAVHDQLTGLVKLDEFRRRLDLELMRARRHAQTVALLMIDVDYFKSVNDRFGHPVGDAVLREVAERIRATVRPTDVPARYGGEEFVVMLPQTDGAGAQVMAERLCARMRATSVKVAQGIAPSVTVSIGVSAYPLDADAVDGLIERADKALYAAKAAGRDRCVAAADLAPA